MNHNSKRCIFCLRGGNLTDEHVFGDWVLRNGYVERTHQKHDFASVSVPHPGQDRLIETRIRAGDPLGSQVRKVCGECNSGWLSNIQELAKPHLIPLFKGQTRILDVQAQKLISTWACMATMTGEHMTHKPDTGAIAQEDREFLMHRRSPPINWRVWLGKRSVKAWPSQWCHVTLRVISRDYIKDGKWLHLINPNVQTTAFRVGNLYVSQ